MDLDAIGGNLPLVAIVIGIILLQFFLRRGRRAESAPREIALSLLSEVRLNQALADTFDQRQKPRRFETVSWQRNKTKLDFLSQSLLGFLSRAFSMAEDFNGQIDSAKKFKSASYLVAIDVDKLKEPLTKSREGLEEYLMAKMGTKEPQPKYPGLSDFLFGGGPRA